MQSSINHDYSRDVSAENYYESVPGCSTFVHQIAHEYDDSFGNVVVYGSAEWPLFSLSEIVRILQIPASTLRDHVMKYEDNLEILRGCRVKLVTMRNGAEVIQKCAVASMLTKFGLYRAMFIADTPLTRLFKRFTYIVLNHLEVNKSVTLRDAKNTLKRSMEKLARERDVLLEKNTMYRTTNRYLAGIANQVRTREDFAMEGTPEYKLLSLMQARYMSQVPIYVVDDARMRAKLISIRKATAAATAAADFTAAKPAHSMGLLQYDIPFDVIDEFYLQEMVGDEFYFHLPPTRVKALSKVVSYNFVGYVHVLDAKHLATVHAQLSANRHNATAIKNVYRITYGGLISAVNDATSDALRQARVPA